jgi:hypothetical protein
MNRFAIAGVTTLLAALASCASPGSEARRRR